MTVQAAQKARLGIALLESIENDDPTALIGLPLIRTAACCVQRDTTAGLMPTITHVHTCPPIKGTSILCPPHWILAVPRIPSTHSRYFCPCPHFGP